MLDRGVTLSPTQPWSPQVVQSKRPDACTWPTCAAVAAGWTLGAEADTAVGLAGSAALRRTAAA
eukprot:1612525-Rhodomonas_salina.1